MRHTPSVILQSFFIQSLQTVFFPPRTDYGENGHGKREHLLVTPIYLEIIVNVLQKKTGTLLIILYLH